MSDDDAYSDAYSDDEFEVTDSQRATVDRTDADAVGRTDVQDLVLDDPQGLAEFQVVWSAMSPDNRQACISVPDERAHQIWSSCATEHLGLGVGDNPQEFVEQLFSRVKSGAVPYLAAVGSCLQLAGRDYAGVDAVHIHRWMRMEEDQVNDFAGVQTSPDSKSDADSKLDSVRNQFYTEILLRLRFSLSALIESAETGDELTGEECLPDAIDQDVAGENHELFHLDDADVAKPAPAAASSDCNGADEEVSDVDVSQVEEEVEKAVQVADADVAKPAPAAASSSVGANDGHCADEEVSDVDVSQVEEEVEKAAQVDEVVPSRSTSSAINDYDDVDDEFDDDVDDDNTHLEGRQQNAVEAPVLEDVGENVAATKDSQQSSQPPSPQPPSPQPPSPQPPSPQPSTTVEEKPSPMAMLKRRQEAAAKRMELSVVPDAGSVASSGQSDHTREPHSDGETASSTFNQRGQKSNFSEPVRRGGFFEIDTMAAVPPPEMQRLLANAQKQRNQRARALTQRKRMDQGRLANVEERLAVKEKGREARLHFQQHERDLAAQRMRQAHDKNGQHARGRQLENDQRRQERMLTKRQQEDEQKSNRLETRRRNDAVRRQQAHEQKQNQQMRVLQRMDHIDHQRKADIQNKLQDCERKAERKQQWDKQLKDQLAAMRKMDDMEPAHDRFKESQAAVSIW